MTDRGLHMMYSLFLCTTPCAYAYDTSAFPSAEVSKHIHTHSIKFKSHPPLSFIPIIFDLRNTTSKCPKNSWLPDG